MIGAGEFAALEHDTSSMSQRRFFSFDTVNTVQAYSCGAEAFDEVERLCARFEKLFSHTDPDSELSRVNASRGKPVEVSCELASLLEAALRYCSETEGLFDITMGPVVRLWDFKRGIVPPPASVDAARIEGRMVCLEDPDACIVLGGIAKGFIADAVLDLLANRGVEHAVVNLGGNVAVMGGKPNGESFVVGLRTPVSSKRQAEGVFAAVPLRNGSVVTSGVYERSFEADGMLYHHILDPHTGFPAQTDLVSVSVIARQSLDADGLSTALAIMGLDRARAFVEAREGVEAVFVTASGEVFATSGASRLPFDRSARSISYMKVFGYHDREISRLYIRSISITVLVSLVACLPILVFALDFIVQLMMSEYSGNLELWVAPQTYVVEVLIGAATYAVVAILHMRRIRRVPLALAMKVQE